MTLVYAGVCSHAPGITGRADLAAPELREPFHAAYRAMGADMMAAKPDVIMVVAAEHFANFFMNNMPAFAIGMADHYEGPIEDPDWLNIPKTRFRGNAELSKRIIEEVMQTVDVSFCEEWRFDHGIMVPLHFLNPKAEVAVIPVNINCQGPPLTPMHRAWAFGEALRRACDKVPERIALFGTGGISHWPCTPDSGLINEAWDREFLERWAHQDKDALLAYDDREVYAEAGQGGFEIRVFAAAAAAARGLGKVHYYAPIPIFAVGCTVASMEIA
jgi:2,3-dihydroxyphenylpropionate 1,2-dioxygenase